MPFRFRIVAILSVGLLIVGACRAPHRLDVDEPPPRASARSVVVWISIDGFRGDYVDRGQTPLLRRLMREGAYSQKLITITPSLTFPSHVTEATGVPAGIHGIASNEFYDPASSNSELLFKMPSDAALLQAEPIWVTATRQGIRTLVYDWPLSYIHDAPVRPAYALPKFEGDLTDEQRLTRITDTWRNDASEKPLRLLMGYIKESDHIGHKYGPESPQIDQTIHQIDAELQRFVDQSIALFDQKMKPGDSLYVLLTTDHGMAPVKTHVNVSKLFSTPPVKEVRIATSGPLALIYLDRLTESDRAGATTAMLADLRKHEDLLSAYTRETLPKEWRLDHPTRVGQIIVMLKPGYTFSTKHEQLTYAVGPGDDPQGMHGYPPSICPEMRGFCVLWRYPSPLGGRNLGTVHAEQFEPTVARLLHIRPADGATAAPMLER